MWEICGRKMHPGEKNAGCPSPESVIRKMKKKLKEVNIL